MGEINVFKNDNGEIYEGDRVVFSVENRSCWCEDLHGLLTFRNNEWMILLDSGRLISIDKGYDAYFNTIRKKTWAK